MVSVSECRRVNLRTLIGERGGLTSLSNRLGYKNPSFLSQMVGPHHSRDVSEKTARKIEQNLGLAPLSLDKTPGYATVASDPPERRTGPQNTSPRPPVLTHEETVAMVADAIRVVGRVCAEEKVNIEPTKFADVVALALEDSASTGQPRAAHVKKLLSLLR